MTSNSLSQTQIEMLSELLDIDLILKAIETDPMAPQVFNSLALEFAEDNAGIEGGSNKNTKQVVSSASTKRQSQSSRRFSLESMHPELSKILSVFDFDGNGKVTLDEVRQGAQLLKDTKKREKVAIKALVVQFVVYSLLTIASCGVLYLLIYRMKDMAVDTSSGMLFVKDESGGTGGGVAVSMKARGSSFSYNDIVTDSATGQEKGCLSSSMVTDMFQHATDGTVMKFTKEDAITKDIVVSSLGTGTASWSNSTVDLGGMILYPDMDCTNRYLEKSGEYASDSQGQRMLLSTEALLDAHVDLRTRFASSLSNDEVVVTANAGRRRLGGGDDVGYSDSKLTDAFMGTFRLELLTNQFPEDTSWTLTDSDDTLLASGGEGYEAQTLYEFETTVREGDYTFTIFDASGDGLCCDYGIGYAKIRFNGELAYSFGYFGLVEELQFVYETRGSNPNPRFFFDLPEISVDASSYVAGAPLNSTHPGNRTRRG